MRFTAAPTIETERLRLRAHTADDYESIVSVWTDPAVSAAFNNRVFSREECWHRTLRYCGLWPAIGYGYWAVEVKSTGQMIGDVGFADYKRAMEPALGDVPEAGWTLIGATHGKGYATEAMRAAQAWGDEHFASRRTVCIIAPDNAPSLAVAAKLGFSEYARGEYNGPIIALERVRA